MSGLPLSPDAPAVVRHNLDAIDELVSCVREGSYCAVLGPRLSGKTVLLQYMARFLNSPLGWNCIYIDLYDLEASTLSGFFGDLIHTVAREGEAATGHALLAAESTRLAAETASSAVFRAFLDEVVLSLERDLVIIIEHLEALPTDVVEALLTSLRAAYMDQQTLDHRAIVIVSGALSLATLTVGESSPFRGIARRIFVGDLSSAQSLALIEEELQAGGISFTANARRRLLEAANGDPYLIRRLCSHGLEQAGEGRRLRGRHVRVIAARFLQDEVYGYAPLQEAIRLIEEDPDLLRCILLLLAHGTVLRSDLPLPLSPDVDPLYLTGVVEPVQADLALTGGVQRAGVTAAGEGDSAGLDVHRPAAGSSAQSAPLSREAYRIQNQIYRQFLDQHFHPGRVGHLLAMAGRWDAALDYLEAGARGGNEQARADLLPATINSMYAAEDLARAAHFLTRGLTAAFGVVEARVWSAQTAENRLRLVAYVGPRTDTRLWASPEMSVTVDRLEARAYRQGRALRGPEGGRHIWRAMPLLVPAESTRASRPVGVVMLCDDLQVNPRVDQRDRDLQLTGYLSQAARAFHAVGVRRQELALAGRMQTSLLPGAPPQLAGWQIAATFRPARETSGDFYDFLALPGGRLGLVVADVTDKGMAAALYMALCRTLLRTYASEHPHRPDLAVAAVNQRLLADTDAGLFVTVFYGILDPVSGSLTYCNAGHHPPYLLQPPAELVSLGTAGLDDADVEEAPPAATVSEDRGSGWGVEALAGRGMALGVVGETRWGYSTVELPAGGLLLIYTDGVVDALSPDGERFGVEQMLDVARSVADRPASEIQARLLAELQQFMGHQPQFDDVTLVAVRREPRAAERAEERVRRFERRFAPGRAGPMWPAAQRGPLDDGQA